ncbi:MAG: F0F1 ATP synthase subunit B [Candidatus Dojkabacteria bacterium]|nr:MAG: F0F1 ATP synthase subunit B [Candidatus Dojkabacteria bacterium]
MSDVLGKIGFDFTVFLYNLINFAIIALLLQKYFFKKVMATIEDRQKLIAEGIEKAEKAEITLAEAEEKRKSVLTDAKEKAKNLVNSATTEAERKATIIVENAEKESSELRKSTQLRLQHEKSQMLSDFKKDAVDVILSTAKKVAKGKEITQDSVTQSLKQ